MKNKIKNIIIIIAVFLCNEVFSQGVVSDTTTYKPAVFYGGKLYKFSYWPIGSGTVTNFSAGNLSPLFTTSEATTTTTPALTFSLSNAVAHKFFGNNTGSTAAPDYVNITAADLPDLSGTYQPLNTNLTTIAGLSATTDNFIQSKSGAWASRTIAQVKSDLGLTGTNSGDQTITLTGDVTGSGTGSFAATIASGAVTLSKIANIADQTILGNNTGGSAAPVALTAAQARTVLGGTTIGQNLFTQANPSAITFPRYNADNSVSALSASAFRTAIDALGKDESSFTLNYLGAGTIAHTYGLSMVNASGTTSLADGQLRLTAVPVMEDATITGVSVYILTQGSYTADNQNKVALFSINPATGLLTNIAESTNSGTLWSATSANNMLNVNFSSPVAVTKGVYFVGLLWNNSASTTTPQLKGAATASNNAVFTNGGNLPNSIDLNGTVSSQNTMPTSLNMSTVSTNTIMPYIELY